MKTKTKPGHIGQHIKKWREFREMDRITLCAEARKYGAQFGEQALGDWERCKRTPQWRNMKAIARVLEIGLDDIECDPADGVADALNGRR